MGSAKNWISFDFLSPLKIDMKWLLMSFLQLELLLVIVLLDGFTS